MKVKIICLFLFILLAAKPLAANQHPVTVENITYYTESYPPANFIENGEIKGISIDTLKAIWKQLKKPEQEILFVPWVRGYRFTLDKSNTALFTMSRTPARESLFKWVGPLFNSTHVLIAKKSKNFQFSSLGQVFYHKVATVEGDISEISLQQVGFPSYNMAKVAKAKQGFLMMQSDRVDMIALSIHGFYHLAQELNFNPDDYEQVWNINKIGNYIAFNINTPDSVINTLQQAFDEIQTERIKIKKRYKLPIEEY